MKRAPILILPTKKILILKELARQLERFEYVLVYTDSFPVDVIWDIEEYVNQGNKSAGIYNIVKNEIIGFLFFGNSYFSRDGSKKIAWNIKLSKYLHENEVRVLSEILAHKLEYISFGLLASGTK